MQDKNVYQYMYVKQQDTARVGSGQVVVNVVTVNKSLIAILTWARSKVRIYNNLTSIHSYFLKHIHI